MSAPRFISPFRYPGGKSWLVPYARNWLSHIDRPDTLLEPFAGGAGIGLMAASERLVERVVLVEIDADVAAVWTLLLSAGESDLARLSALVRDFEPSVEAVRSILSDEPCSTLSRAFRAVIANRFSRGGVMAPGAGLLKAGERGRGIASRWYPATLVKRFEHVSALRDRICFIHGDAFEEIPSHSGSVMFVDPPYTAGGKSAGSRLYAHHQVDHELLFSLAARHASSLLMTYDDAPEVRSLAKHHSLSVVEAEMVSAHGRRTRELLLHSERS